MNGIGVKTFKKLSFAFLEILCTLKLRGLKIQILFPKK